MSSNTIEMYCPYCGSQNLVPYPKFGPDWYKCNDCLSKFNNPIIIDFSVQPNETPQS
jgi:transposase-like protein